MRALLTKKIQFNIHPVRAKEISQIINKLV